MDSSFEAGRKKRRPNFSVDFKRSLAQRACEPGVSVSQLAQGNNIHLNMVFKWRRELLTGLFDAPKPVAGQIMLPVTIVDSSALAETTLPEKDCHNSGDDGIANGGLLRQGLIEVQLGAAIVRFDRNADLAMLGAVVRMLRT